MSAERRAPREGFGPDPARVRFEVDFRRRLDRLTLRLDRLRRRVEGPGGARELGEGEEWIGFRPYRPGDDPRRLDWQLLARLDRPFVKLTRREASERWALAIDTSASMGLGSPGKLQAAAELAAGWIALGLRTGAEVRARSAGDDRPARVFRRPSALPAALAWLESLVAGGDETPAVDASRVGLGGAGRLLVLTDLDTPADEALFVAARRRRVTLVRVLAPHELDPPLGPVTWVDPEGGSRLALDVDRALADRYSAALSARLERGRRACGRHGILHRVHPTDLEFERGLEALVGAASPARRAAAR